MSTEGRHGNREPRIDLKTVRDTIAYMQADMASSERLAGVRAALSKALDEIARAEKAAPASNRTESARVVPFPGARPRFVPWSQN